MKKAKYQAGGEWTEGYDRPGVFQAADTRFHETSVTVSWNKRTGHFVYQISVSQLVSW
jgi:hypothetical protein